MNFIGLAETLNNLAESLLVHEIFSDSEPYKFSESARIFHAALKNNPDTQPKWISSPIKFIAIYNNNHVRKTPIRDDTIHSEGMKILLHSQQ